MSFKDEKGQAMVEFVLVLPILFLFICGIIDFGWIFGNQLLAENASREAARACAVDETADAEAIVTARAPTLPSPIVTKIISGQSVSVSIDVDLPTLTALASTIFGNSFHMEAESTMRIEYN